MSVELALALVGCAAALSLLVAVLALLRLRTLARTVEELRAEPAVSRSRAPAGEVSVPPGPPGEGPLADAAASMADGATGDSGTGSEPYVITRLGEQRVDDAGAARVEPRTFADMLAKETLVKSAGLVHGLRRALDPATRNRIRFEMRREVKRSKRERKVEMKQAWREYQARQRAGVRLDRGDVA